MLQFTYLEILTSRRRNVADASSNDAFEPKAKMYLLGVKLIINYIVTSKIPKKQHKFQLKTEIEAKLKSLLASYAGNKDIKFQQLAIQSQDHLN